MAVNAHERYFVEWKEQYVFKERVNRVVHYFLKDNSGDSILSAVGSERSVRHMFYVVSHNSVGRVQMEVEERGGEPTYFHVIQTT